MQAASLGLMPESEQERDARLGIDNMTPEEVDELLREKLKHKELRTEGLVKRYGRRTVADQVTFNVRQGEIVGLLGPCLLYTSPSPRDGLLSRMPSSA